MSKGLSESDFLNACIIRDCELLVACLAAGMKVNKRLPNGLTPIIVCCQNRFAEAIQALCEKGAALNEGCGDTTALLEAVRNEDCASVQHLLGHGANPDIGTKKHLRPLMLAARMGALDCVRLLLAGNAGVNLTDKYLWSALHEAAAFGHEDVVRLLLSHGANPLVGTKEHLGNEHPLSLIGFTPLHYAARAGHTGVVEALLECTPVDVRGRGGETALMFAVQGNRNTVSALLCAGADVEAVSRFGTTPLINAVANGNLDVIGLLLESGANPNADHGDIGPPVGMAVREIPGRDNRDRVAIVKILMTYGADINLPCAEDGCTALYHAVCAKDADLVRFLLDHGARYGSMFADRTAVDIAYELGMPQMAELILSYGALGSSG